MTASRELYEESCKLIDIQVEQIKALPAFSWGNYKMFSVCINHDGPLQDEYFEANREQLKVDKAKRVYFESIALLMSLFNNCSPMDFAISATL